MSMLSLFVSLATAILAISHQVSVGQYIPNLPVQPLPGIEAFPNFSCLSWRLGVETNNIRDWQTIPIICEIYIADYMLRQQYWEDSKAVTDEAFLYAKRLEVAGDGMDIWIFDVDETSLSNLFLYAQFGFGAVPINGILDTEWKLLGNAPALPASLELYRNLLNLGIKVVFLTGRLEILRVSTEINLRNAGYHTWEKLILRDWSNWSQSQVEYKSFQRAQLVDSGYRIVGNIGDQWSDLLGQDPGKRTFKLPNPMYYTE